MGNAVVKKRQKIKSDFCRLCFSTDSDLNNEDVIPVWVRALLISAQAQILGTAPTMMPPRVLLRICKKHNSTLSTILENRVSPFLKPLLAGEAALLRPEEQHLLLSWLVKTSKLLDLLALDEYDRGEKSDFRGVMNREELQSLVLNLIDRGGSPLSTWATAIAHVDNGESVPLTASVAEEDMSITPLRHPEMTHISSYGSLLALTMVGTAETVRDFVADYSDDHRLTIISKDSTETVSWPPSRSIQPSAIIDLRRVAGHAPPMGWVSGVDTQVSRRRAKQMPAIHFIGDDAENLVGLSHAVRMGMGGRTEIGIVNLKDFV